MLMSVTMVFSILKVCMEQLKNSGFPNGNLEVRLGRTGNCMRNGHPTDIFIMQKHQCSLFMEQTISVFRKNRLFSFSLPCSDWELKVNFYIFPMKYIL